MIFRNNQRNRLLALFGDTWRVDALRVFSGGFHLAFTPSLFGARERGRRCVSGLTLGVQLIIGRGVLMLRPYAYSAAREIADRLYQRGQGFRILEV